MGRKLTKALRGKRRWIGLHFEPGISDRRGLDARLSSVLAALDLDHPTRLMDVIPAGGGTHPEQTVGRAVLCVRLEDTVRVRQALEPAQAMETHGIQCITSSGKLRLVRERMNLPRPKQRR